MTSVIPEKGAKSYAQGFKPRSEGQSPSAQQAAKPLDLIRHPDGKSDFYRRLLDLTVIIITVGLDIFH
jgi:hypothetical protein